MAAESRLTPSHSSRKPATESAGPNARAAGAGGRPGGRGGPAGGQRARGSAAHVTIGLAFIPLVERGGAGGDQAGAENGVKERPQVDGLEEAEPVGRARQSEKITDARAHENEPGNSRFSECYVIAHPATAIPPRARFGLARSSCQYTLIRCSGNGAGFGGVGYLGVEVCNG